MTTANDPTWPKTRQIAWPRAHHLRGCVRGAPGWGYLSFSPARVLTEMPARSAWPPPPPSFRSGRGFPARRDPWPWPRFLAPFNLKQPRVGGLHPPPGAATSPATNPAPEIEAPCLERPTDAARRPQPRVTVFVPRPHRPGTAYDNPARLDGKQAGGRTGCSPTAEPGPHPALSAAAGRSMPCCNPARSAKPIVGAATRGSPGCSKALAISPWLPGTKHRPPASRREPDPADL